MSPETAADAKPPQSSTKELELQIRLQELTLREKELDNEHEKLRVLARQEELKNTLELKRLEYESKRWSQAVLRDEFQVSRYIKMVPDLTGKEVEKYFPHFERVAITLEWPKPGVPKLFHAKAPQTSLASGRDPQTHRQCYKICK